MDFLSIILAAFGWGKDHAAKVSDYRTEAFRLNAEVASECMRAINMLAFATPNIMRRLEVLYPGQPELYKGCTETLATLRSQAEQIYSMAESYKAMTEKASGWSDWDTLLRKLHEWRATASALCPYTEGIIKQFEDTVAEEVARRTTLPPVSIRRNRDRGWDAPPL